jgi:large subunit ribosomal protein L3
MRTGLIAKKVGMSVVYSEDGTVIPVTLLLVDDCQVISAQDKGDNKLSVQVGAGSVKLKNVTKPLKGHFAKNEVAPKHKMVEFRVSANDTLTSGTNLTAGHFVAGQFVDVVGTSVGKGFAGWMKRWNFAGLRASHGVSIAHRSGGSTGQCQDPGKVAKGKKMPGQMGAKRVTIQNLKVIFVDEDKKIVGVKGAVPGHKDGYVLIKDAVKKALPQEAPHPTLIQDN